MRGTLDIYDVNHDKAASVWGHIRGREIAHSAKIGDLVGCTIIAHFKWVAFQQFDIDNNQECMLICDLSKLTFN